ncbi:GNAT family N-acetyltransferase [uncultured Tateyamaria sp.]|uniref:GNAT family N-acetyltransferase n=1 Tax=uncultured Tateyamaria sp. TaxID=455651 RepID=UPI00263039B0|nr:GNAT family N-acetyltransferase [uncultured Tateyamaria sp.]
MIDLEIHSARPSDMDDVARLCWAYRDLLIERSVDLPQMVEAYYAKDSYAALVADLPRIHARPKGDILVAKLGNQIVGCAMYYPLTAAGTTEIKRVYVAPAARGSGAGRALIQESIARAKADGYARVVLDTMNGLTEAIALYERLGFQPCPPYYDAEPSFLPYLRFFEHPL